MFAPALDVIWTPRNQAITSQNNANINNDDSGNDADKHDNDDNHDNVVNNDSNDDSNDDNNDNNKMGPKRGLPEFLVEARLSFWICIFISQGERY